MKRLFTMAFFACGWIGLLLNLVFILVSFSREAEIGSAWETAMEALWIGGTTFFGLGALILEEGRIGSTFPVISRAVGAQHAGIKSCGRRMAQV
jgi:hypothetical protein